MLFRENIEYSYIERRGSKNNNPINNNRYKRSAIPLNCCCKFKPAIILWILVIVYREKIKQTNKETKIPKPNQNTHHNKNTLSHVQKRNTAMDLVLYSYFGYFILSSHIFDSCWKAIYLFLTFLLFSYVFVK